MKKQQIKGITLIALVITIIVLLILASISIATLTGENGILTKALKAKKATEISEYYEKIEIIRNELRLQKENYELPTLVEFQKEFEEHQKEWVASTEIKLIERVEKLELITKEGYIFHITSTKTQYVGTGKVVDISDLTKEEVLKLEIVGDTNNRKTSTNNRFIRKRLLPN